MLRLGWETARRPFRESGAPAMRQQTIARLAVTVALVARGARFLDYSSTSDSQHYEIVGHLLTPGLDKFKDNQIRLHGLLETGTIATEPVAQATRPTFALK